jgi:hypothetical protein
LPTRLTHYYLDRVIRAATMSRHAHFGFLDVIQLVDPPSALFRPGVLLPALIRGGDADRATPLPLTWVTAQDAEESPLPAPAKAGHGAAMPRAW